MQVRFLKSVFDLAGLPPPHLPEVVIVGRSNVGKSSLINALVGQKGMARVSSTPGRTQSINLFNWNDEMLLVDLPGYGFHQTSAKVAKNWAGLIEDYLASGRPRAALLLLDPRRKLEPTDQDLLIRLSEQTKTWLILTKTDKLSRSELQLKQRELQSQIPHQVETIVTSTNKNIGIAELKKILIANARK